MRESSARKINHDSHGCNQVSPFYTNVAPLYIMQHGYILRIRGSNLGKPIKKYFENQGIFY